MVKSWSETVWETKAVSEIIILIQT